MLRSNAGSMERGWMVRPDHAGRKISQKKALAAWVALGMLAAGTVTAAPAGAQQLPSAGSVSTLPMKGSVQATAPAPKPAPAKPAPAPAKPAPAPAAAAPAPAPAAPAPAPDAKAAEAKPPAAPDAKAPDAKTPDAKAPEAKSPTADAEKEAAKKREDGIKALGAKQPEKALDALTDSFKLKASWETALPLARVEMQLNRPRDAAEHLDYFLRNGFAAKPEDRQAAEKLLAEAKAKVGTVTVHVDVTEAEVLVDEKPVGKSPLLSPVFVDPGDRKISARKEGLPEAAQDLKAAAGAESTVELTLTPPPPAPVAPPPPPAPWWAHNKTILFAGLGTAGGLALVGIGTAIGSAVVGSSSHSKWEDNHCTRTNAQCVSDFQSSQHTKATLGNTAFWTFIGAAAVGGGTAAYWFLTGKKAAPATQAGFVVAPGGGAVVMTGSF
jgi:hypothetical protein